MTLSGPNDIAAAAALLKAGGVVAFPTETVYGLGADARNAEAVRRVFKLKGRPEGNPLIVHVSDIAMARECVSDWPQAAQALAERFWPGPLTLVLPKAADIPAEVTAGAETVGVRCPDHPMALELIRAFGGPIVGPSANRSGFVSPTTADHVRAGFAPSEVMILDGGPCKRGIESTVLSLAGDEPLVLRAGAIPAEDLTLDPATEGVGAMMITPPYASLHDSRPAAARPPSPGQSPSHYAPRAPTVLFDAPDWPGLVVDVEGRVVVLTHDATRHVNPPHVLILMPEDADAYAAKLYAAVRQADAMNPALIAIERPREKRGLWFTILDRLTRMTYRGPRAE